MEKRQLLQQLLKWHKYTTNVNAHEGLFLYSCIVPFHAIHYNGICTLTKANCYHQHKR